MKKYLMVIARYKDWRQEFFETHMSPRNKEYCDLNNLESWTEKGWTKIDRVIRHRLIKKKLFRISTNSGSVVVTEDHSLLTNKGK